MGNNNSSNHSDKTKLSNVISSDKFNAIHSDLELNTTNSNNNDNFKSNVIQNFTNLYQKYKQCITIDKAEADIFASQSITANYKENILHEIQSFFLDNRGILQSIIIDFLIQNNDPVNFEQIWNFDNSVYDFKKTYNFVCEHKLEHIAISLFTRHYKKIDISGDTFEIACKNGLVKLGHHIMELRKDLYDVQTTFNIIIKYKLEELVSSLIKQKPTQMISNYKDNLVLLSKLKMENAVIQLIEAKGTFEYNIYSGYTFCSAVENKNNKVLEYIIQKFGTYMEYNKERHYPMYKLVHPETENICLSLLQNEHNYKHIIDNKLLKEIVNLATKNKCNNITDFLSRELLIY